MCCNDDGKCAAPLFCMLALSFGFGVGILVHSTSLPVFILMMIGVAHAGTMRISCCHPAQSSEVVVLPALPAPLLYQDCVACVGKCTCVLMQPGDICTCMPVQHYLDDLFNYTFSTSQSACNRLVTDGMTCRWCVQMQGTRKVGHGKAGQMLHTAKTNKPMCCNHFFGRLLSVHKSGV